MDAVSAGTDVGVEVEDTIRSDSLWGEERNDWHASQETGGKG